METAHRNIDDLGVVLQVKRFGERDVILQILTENHGRIPSIVKGGVQSRRFGGTLQFLTFSQFHFVQKPHAELARIDSATLRTQFEALPKHFSAYTVSAFFMEFATKVLEPWAPAREFFLILANGLFHLNKALEQNSLDNKAEDLLARGYLSLFILKSMNALGYDPKIENCGLCGEKFEKIPTAWNPQWGGFLCEVCRREKFAGAPQQLTQLSHISGPTYEALKLFSQLPFQTLTPDVCMHLSQEIPEIQTLLIQFLQFHLTHCDLKTLSLIRENLVQ